MFNWLREFYSIRKEFKTCVSCETLLLELARLREDNVKLLDRLLEKPVEPTIDLTPVDMTKTTRIPWRARQQMLEEQDRDKARLLRNAPKPDKEIEALEKELGVGDAISGSNEKVQ